VETEGLAGKQVAGGRRLADWGWRSKEDEDCARIRGIVWTSAWPEAAEGSMALGRASRAVGEPWRRAAGWSCAVSVRNHG
jgi:hypothetical protein